MTTFSGAKDSSQLIKCFVWLRTCSGSCGYHSENCKYILKDFIAPSVFGYVVRLANSTVRPSAEAVGSAFEAPGVGS
ncbi:hypothetical protein MRX96_051202 [Rhipicephalus microplus]